MADTLTEKRLQSIKAPTTGRLEITDGALRGLVLRVTPADVRSWYYSYTLNGKRSRVQLGTYPALTLANARQTAKIKAADVAKGIDPAREKRRTREQGKTARENSIEAIAARYITEYAKPNNRTWHKTETDLKTHVLPKWGKMPISQVDHGDAARLIDGINSKSGPHMARLVRSHLHTLFRWAEERKIIDDNPIRKVGNPLRNLPKSRKRVLSLDEIKKVWAGCESIGWPYGPLVRVLLYTGQRKGEVANMRWSDLDLDGGAWHLSAEQTKSGKKSGEGHTVPLAPQVVGLLRSLPVSKDCDYVFTYGNGKPVNSFGAMKAEIDTVSGVSDWRLHDLRRSAGTHMGEQCDISYETIGSVLNHSRMGVTAIYDRSTRLRQRTDALVQWANYLDALIRGDKDADNGGDKIVLFTGGKR